MTELAATQSLKHEAQCCRSSRVPHQSGGRVPTATASALSILAAVFVPKCPLCLAAWLTATTGITFSTASAAWLRSGIVLLSVALVTAAAWRTRR